MLPSVELIQFIQNLAFKFANGAYVYDLSVNVMTENCWDTTVKAYALIGSLTLVNRDPCLTRTCHLIVPNKWRVFGEDEQKFVRRSKGVSKQEQNRKVWPKKICFDIFICRIDFFLYFQNLQESSITNIGCYCSYDLWIRDMYT